MTPAPIQTTPPSPPASSSRLRSPTNGIPSSAPAHAKTAQQAYRMTRFSVCRFPCRKLQARHPPQHFKFARLPARIASPQGAAMTLALVQTAPPPPPASSSRLRSPTNSTSSLAPALQQARRMSRFSVLKYPRRRLPAHYPLHHVNCGGSSTSLAAPAGTAMAPTPTLTPPPPASSSSLRSPTNSTPSLTPATQQTRRMTPKSSVPKYPRRRLQPQPPVPLVPA